MTWTLARAVQHAFDAEIARCLECGAIDSETGIAAAVVQGGAPEFLVTRGLRDRAKGLPVSDLPANVRTAASGMCSSTDAGTTIDGSE